MHSFIILSHSKTVSDNKTLEITKRFSISEFRKIIIDQNPDIKTIRQSLKTLYAQASHEYQALIIKDLQKLSESSQQTLLKTIEEPPLNSICIIQAGFSDSILPTLVSRSEIIRIASEEALENENSIALYWKPIITGFSLTHRLTEASTINSTYKEKDALTKWLDGQILFFRNLMYRRLETKKENKLTSNQIAKIITALLKAKRYIHYNCNQKLVIDNLFLTIHN